MATTLKQKMVRFTMSIHLLFPLGACISTTGIEPQSKILTDQALNLAHTDHLVLQTTPFLQAYHCDELDKLIIIALKKSPSLKLAEAKVRQADALVAGIKASDGPNINAQASATRQHLSSYGMIPAPLGGAMSNLYDTQISFSYLFDIWGKTREEVAAGLSETSARQIEAQETSRILALTVASRYFQYQILQKEIALLKQIVQMRQEMLHIVEKQYQAGIGEKALVDRMKIQYLFDSNTLEEINTQSEKTRHALAVLLGTTTSQLKLKNDSVLPKAQLTDLHMLQADQIAQRADVQATRLRVESYLHTKNAAQKMFYPTISLSALIGFNALQLKNWFKRDAYESALTPAIHLPIFQAGSLRANLRNQTAQYDMAVETYNQTVLEAIQDASNKYADLSLTILALNNTQKTYTSAVGLKERATARYRAGILPKSQSLDTQITYLNSVRQLNTAKNQRLQKELAMIGAIGG